MEAHIYIAGDSDEEILANMDKAREALRKRMISDVMGMDQIEIELVNIEVHVTGR